MPRFAKTNCQRQTTSYSALSTKTDKTTILSTATYSLRLSGKLVSNAPFGEYRVMYSTGYQVVMYSPKLGSNALICP